MIIIIIRSGRGMLDTGDSLVSRKYTLAYLGDGRVPSFITNVHIA
jgi:hypothetical protein